jgi:multidrug efflux system membrane fusion protein
MTFERNQENHSTDRAIPRKIATTPMVLVFMTALILFTACKNEGEKKSGKGKSGEKPPAPVTVAQAAEKKIPVEIEGTGHVEAGTSVNVRPRISGKLLSVHFKEGESVVKGDLLFTVDPAPFKTKIEQARADLERDRAKLNLAAKQVKRYSTLSDKGYLSEEEYEQLQNDVAVLTASVRADKAAAESANLDLSYCSVRAEISGVAGEIAVDPGNLVAPNDSAPLTTIRQIEKLDVSFSVPEQHFREIRTAMAKGAVSVRTQGDGASAPIAKGVLTFIDNSIDSATGTVMLKATFANKDKFLWPGQFVRVVVGLPVEESGISVPSQSVQTGQKGSYVYVLKNDMNVEYRDVVIGRTFNGDTLITKGLSSGESVVVEGQLKLSPGAAVKVAKPGEPEKADNKTGNNKEKAGQ